MVSFLLRSAARSNVLCSTDPRSFIDENFNVYCLRTLLYIRLNGINEPTGRHFSTLLYFTWPSNFSLARAMCSNLTS